MNSKIYAKDVLMETIFELFFRTVWKDGGDGAACICCSNIDETADEFVKWFAKSEWNCGGDVFFHPRHEYIHDDRRTINFHDSNENFMFCNKEIDLGHGDMSIVILEDCRSGISDFVIKKLEQL